MIIIKNAKIFDGECFIKQSNIFIDHGKICDLNSKKNVDTCNAKIIDAKGQIVAPGFIDIQLNGSGGVLFNENISINSLQKIFNAHVQYGTTSFLPTLITDSLEKIPLAFDCVTKAIQNKINGVVGLHLEGPFINESKSGIHPKKHIKQLNEVTVSLIKKIPKGVTLVTLAPECTESKFIRLLLKNKVIVFAGHTNATYAQMKMGFDIGIKGVTHLFNACSPFLSREPGVVGASLLDSDSYAGIIADGHHVTFESLKLAFKVKETKKFILVSDAMTAFGTDMKNFYVDDKKIFVNEGRYTNADGTLAGASLCVYKGFLNLVKNKLVSFEEGLQMASTNAAECFDLDKIFKIGRILPGYSADLVMLGERNLQLSCTVYSGNVIVLNKRNFI